MTNLVELLETVTGDTDTGVALSATFMTNDALATPNQPVRNDIQELADWLGFDVLASVPGGEIESALATIIAASDATEAGALWAKRTQGWPVELVGPGARDFAAAYASSDLIVVENSPLSRRSITALVAAAGAAALVAVYGEALLMIALPVGYIFLRKVAESAGPPAGETLGEGISYYLRRWMKLPKSGRDDQAEREREERERRRRRRQP